MTVIPDGWLIPKTNSRTQNAQNAQNTQRALRVRVRLHSQAVELKGNCLGKPLRPEAVPLFKDAGRRRLSRSRSTLCAFWCVRKSHPVS